MPGADILPEYDKVYRRSMKMKKSCLLVRSNLRRAKGQAAIMVLMLLAAAMLNLWLMLAMDYRQNFDRYHDKLHAEHVALLVDSRRKDMNEYLTEVLEGDSRTADYRLDDILSMVGSFAYNGGELNSYFAIFEKEAALSRPIGAVEIVEDSSHTSGIYLPMLYKTGDLDVGRTIEITIGNHPIRYTICGFFNSVMAGSHNCGMCALLLTEDKYRELEENGYALPSTLVSVRIDDGSESEDFEAMLKNALSAEYPDTRPSSTSYTLVSQSRYISQMICSGVVSAMAFFILLIAVVVISSNIVNYIQENMRNLGALKTIGYTGRQLACALLLQFLGITLLAALAGIILSYCLFPAVNTMMTAQTGIPYSIRFLPFPLLAVLLILCGSTALTVWLSSRRIKAVDPITALRQGILTHNFKRSHVALEKTSAPLQLALSLKTTLSGIRQNLTVSITMLVLSLVVVFSGLMLENMILDMEPFLNMIVGEIADSCISISAETEEAFLQDISRDGRVEKVYLYHSVEVRHVGGLGLLATLCDDFSKANNQGICPEGRFPKYDNEVAIGIKYAKENGLKIGEEIRLTAEGKEESYLISGFTQISNNLGKDCLLTRSGYERLGSLSVLNYYLNLPDDVDIDAFNEDISARFPGNIYAALNIASTVSGATSVYVSLMTIIVIAVLILSVIIIAFVLYLLVRTMLNNKKRDYGILKALGFTTGQLILQTALSFMPAVILSTTAGMLLCSMIINPLTSLFLRGIGIVKCTFAIPVRFNVLAGAALILLSFAIACLLSLKIRRIVPRALLAGE